MLVMNLLNIAFIGYIIFTIIIIKNITIISSALIRYVGYINLYMFKRKSNRVAIFLKLKRIGEKLIINISMSRLVYYERNLW